MSRARVNYSAFGRRARELALPDYAMKGEGETKIDAVCRAIERNTRLVVVTCRPDGTAIFSKHDHRAQYQLTLGTPAPGGGWTPKAEIWVQIP